MILVTLGTQKQQFKRLLNYIETITIQVNTTNYTLEQIHEDIEKNLDKYLKDVSFKEESSIAYFAIADKIFNSKGVKNIVSLTINGSKDDISIADTQIAKLGSVIYG